MHLSILFIAALASVAIALPQHNLKVKRLETESDILVARAPTEEKPHLIASRAEPKCFIPEGCPFISVGSSSSVSIGAAFTLSGSLSFLSGGSLKWEGLSQFGFKGTEKWKNNFKGACQDFGIFVNGFSGLTTTFKSSLISWDGAQLAIKKFGTDFFSFCDQLSSFGGFGSVESGKQIFQGYFISCFKTFQSFFQEILNRYGETTFSKTDIFGQFQSGFKTLFKFTLTIGIESLSILKSAEINFELFKKCGFSLESWISAGSISGSSSSGSGSSGSGGGGSSGSGGKGSLGSAGSVSSGSSDSTGKDSSGSINTGGKSTSTIGAAFTLSGSLSFLSGGSLQWGGLSQFGYKGVEQWKNNFKGASKDFGIFINGFYGLTTTFSSSIISWDSAQLAITKFGADFSSFCNELSSFGGFGSFEGGKQLFQGYFVDCFKTFQSFFQVILNRYGEITFQKTEIFGPFQIGFKFLFKFASTIGLGSKSVLESAKIDFTLFKKCGFALESWIGAGISARHLEVEMF